MPLKSTITSEVSISGVRSFAHTIARARGSRLAQATAIGYYGSLAITLAMYCHCYHVTDPQHIMDCENKAITLAILCSA